MEHLQKKDHKLYQERGIRRYWIVNNIADYFNDIKKAASSGKLKGKKGRTFDFTTMYTNLKHEDIIAKVRIAVAEAIAYQTETRANDIRLANTETIPDIEVIMKHVRFIVENTYLSNDPENLIKQIIGIPMGTNCASDIANLALYAVEAAFIDALLADGLVEEAMAHALTARYIDDLSTWGDALAGGISPPTSDQYGLIYGETTNADGSLQYLGAKLEMKEGDRLEISVFDKHQEWGDVKVEVIKFPHHASNNSQYMTRGILVGQLHRIRTICNTIKGFKAGAQNVVTHMIKRGHDPVMLIRGWEAHLIKFSHDKITRYQELRGWFNRMLGYEIAKDNAAKWGQQLRRQRQQPRQQQQPQQQQQHGQQPGPPRPLRGPPSRPWVQQQQRPNPPLMQQGAGRYAEERIDADEQADVAGRMAAIRRQAAVQVLELMIEGNRLPETLRVQAPSPSVGQQSSPSVGQQGTPLQTAVRTAEIIARRHMQLVTPPRRNHGHGLGTVDVDAGIVERRGGRSTRFTARSDIPIHTVDEALATEDRAETFLQTLLGTVPVVTSEVERAHMNAEVIRDLFGDSDSDDDIAPVPSGVDGIIPSSVGNIVPSSISSYVPLPPRRRRTPNPFPPRPRVSRASEQPTGKESLGRIPDYTRRFPGLTGGSTWDQRSTSVVEDDDGFDDDDNNPNIISSSTSMIRAAPVGRTSSIRRAFSDSNSSDYRGGHMISSATTSRTPSATLLVTPTDLVVVPPAILAVALTDQEVGVLELTLANTTLANLTFNSHKRTIYNGEDLRLLRTRVVERANIKLRQPVVIIDASSKKKKSVTFESEHPTPTAGLHTVPVSVSSPFVRAENNREGLRGRINPPTFLSPVLRGKSHSSRRE
jgi:hypothetical protein